MPSLPKFTMEFQPATIEHLGLKLYSTLPPVIGELVSNAWDGDASLVEISFPDGELTDGSEVVVRDNGHGMTPAALQEEYLKIGLNRREAKGTDLSPGGRRVTGRKGLGKLSVFGVADQLEIRSVVDGQAVCLLLDYPTMKSWPKTTAYEPKVVGVRTGQTKDPNGTEIRIQRLRRKKPIGPDWIRRELARRFTLLRSDFKVTVNGVAIKPSDRRLKDQCKKWWDVNDLDGAGLVDGGRGWKVKGWIGLVEKTSQVDRGVDIFARGKAVELDTMFGLKTTHAQFGRAYIVGEVHAEFLDAEEDYIATPRNSAMWESEAGQKLQEWGQKALTDVLKRWLELRHKDKEEQVFKISRFDEWLETRSTREQKAARRMLDIIITDESIEPDSASRLLDIVKSNIEFAAFQDLVDEIESPGINVATLLRLFDEWKVFEARELLRLSDGQLEAMTKLAKFIEKGALEVQQLQPLFEQNPWLIDPAWTTAETQTTYTVALRKYAKEKASTDPKDRRMDILGIRVSGELEVVEIKRPEKVLSWDDLNQIERYVTWARATLQGSGPNAPRYVRGRLIVGRLNPNNQVQQKVKTLAAADVRVETFGDLLERSKTVYGSIEKRYKKIAPEYSKSGRRAAKRKGKNLKGKKSKGKRQ